MPDIWAIQNAAVSYYPSSAIELVFSHGVLADSRHTFRMKRRGNSVAATVGGSWPTSFVALAGRARKYQGISCRTRRLSATGGEQRRDDDLTGVTPRDR
jgi:hypothetical protein